MKRLSTRRPALARSASTGTILLATDAFASGTWTDYQVLAGGTGQGSWVVVGADHAVYVFWLSGTSIVVRKSTDRGLTFGAPGAGGLLTVFDGQPSGTAHCVLDVSGYFAGWP